MGAEHLKIVEATDKGSGGETVDPHITQFELTVVSCLFEGLDFSNREQLVNDALAPESLSRRIAVVRMELLTPAQFICEEMRKTDPSESDGEDSSAGSTFSDEPAVEPEPLEASVDVLLPAVPVGARAS